MILPIIILTVLVICAIVLGYLIQKVNNMTDLINNRLDGLKNIKPESKPKLPDKCIKVTFRNICIFLTFLQCDSK